MKELTQDVFKEAPKWVKSAAIDSKGELWFHNVSVGELNPVTNSRGGYWYIVVDNFGEWCRFYLERIESGYNPTDWQSSAIDRA